MKRFVLLALVAASLLPLAPQRADCAACLTSGMTCYHDLSCGSDCRCIRINGMGKPGICG